jgi:hypothetical protein
VYQMIINWNRCGRENILCSKKDLEYICAKTIALAQLTQLNEELLTKIGSHMYILCALIQNRIDLIGINTNTRNQPLFH